MADSPRKDRHREKWGTWNCGMIDNDGDLSYMRPPHGDRSSEEKDYVDSWVNDTVSSTQVM
jgi:hypothetical protein